MSEREVGVLEEQSLPMLISMFEELELPVTFAIRGQLLEVDESIPKRLIKSPVKFDLASHGYYHRVFSGLTRIEAEHELSMVQEKMNNLQNNPTSFIFPKNHINHLDLLEKHGYRAFRGAGGSYRDDVRITKVGGLYDVHASLFLTKSANPRLLSKLLDVTIKRKLPFHVWFHPKDLGNTNAEMEKSIQRVYRPFFKKARDNQKMSLLRIETMSSVVEMMERTT
jgi:peptidoglycan/xylan/chitin deacetylase (PgdA/CDA1 family)